MPDRTIDMTHSTSRPLGLLLIGLFKLFKGILFFLLAVWTVRLIDKDVADVFLGLITRLHIDAEGRFIQSVLAHLSLIDNRMLVEISTATFGFSLLLLTEGTGLIMQKLWAEYVAIIETGFFIPFEIYEITRHLTTTKVTLFLINTAVVVYLILRMSRKGMAQAKTAGAAGK
jgi:uncharacterized membrane protein (DUF2068 family)